jgi:alpha-amylase
MQLAQNILTFNILYEGIPVLYYGQEHNLNGSFNPVNREALWLTGYDTSTPLYKLTSILNTLRTHAITSNDTYLDYIGRVIHHDEHTLAVRKGFDENQIIMLLNNNGAESSTSETTLSDTGFREGKTVIEVIGCKTMTAGREGDLAVRIERGAPQVFYPIASLEGTSICKGGDQDGSGNGGGDSKKPNASPELMKSFSTGLCVSVFIWIWFFISQ